MSAIYDFHTHSLLSDGDVSPIELIRRAAAQGYKAIAITDHVGLGTLARVVTEVAKDCALAGQYWDIVAIPGVELTHIPIGAIKHLARQAKTLGARLVIVHGETIVEPVEPGTNLAAAQSPDVDILAHPGLLTLEEARLAAQHGIYLEISARCGHCLGNGRTVRTALEAGAKLLLNSDAHEDKDLLTPSQAEAIALGADLQESQLQTILQLHPQQLLEKLQKKS
ncbi:MAG: histidinol phosphate phosphatase domain-containing protein [Chloroflexi bacterium]|nr:histidinol phosphate phosphatase domain-containing protein [Chloroflexota bacterium]